MDLLLINIYSSLLSGLFMIGIGFFIFFKNPKEKLNIIFLLFCSAVAIWLLATFMMYRSDTDVEIIFWDRIVYVGAVFIPILMYHFGLVFTTTENKNKIKLYFGYLGSLIFLVLSRTNYFVDNLYKYNWGVHTQAKILHHFFLLFFFLYVILFLIEIYNFLKKEKEKLEKRRVEYLFISFLIMNIGAYAFLPAYGVNINPLGAYGVEIIAVLILAFAILKYHLFEIRVILTEILVGMMGILLLVFPFLLPRSYKILGLGVFLLFCLFGYFLIRATHREIKRREEIEKLYAELRVLDRAKSEFISMASHQLRTPLTAIKGYISMMLEGSYNHLSPRVKEKMKNVFQSNERLIKIVNNLLNISKIELGKMESEKEPTQIEDLIQSCYEELKIEAKKKGLRFYFQKPKKVLPKISIDFLKIRQVILNLIDNAIRYTQKGEIEIRAEKKNSKILISIRDTGEGLTEDEKKRIFEGFSRGAAGIAYWIEGAGLGLYVAKKYIELHRGKIWAESGGKGKGSIFYVELPTW